MVNAWIAPMLIPGYVIGGTLCALGVIGVFINAMLESYYESTENWGVIDLPVWMVRLRLTTLWTARIGTFVASWTLVLHCYMDMTGPGCISWWGLVTVLVIIEVCCVLNTCEIVDKPPDLVKPEDRAKYRRDMEHALYAVISPCVTFLFMMILTLVGVIWIW